MNNFNAFILAYTVAFLLSFSLYSCSVLFLLFLYLSVFSPVKVVSLLQGYVGHVTIQYHALHSWHRGSILLAYLGTVCSVPRDSWERRYWFTDRYLNRHLGCRSEGLDSPISEQYNQTAGSFIK